MRALATALLCALVACATDPELEPACPEPGEPYRCPDGMNIAEYGQDPSTAETWFVCRANDREDLRCEASCASGRWAELRNGELFCVPVEMQPRND